MLRLSLVATALVLILVAVRLAGGESSDPEPSGPFLLQGAPIDSAPVLAQERAQDEGAVEQDSIAREASSGPEASLPGEAAAEPDEDDTPFYVDFADLDWPDYVPADERGEDGPERLTLEDFPEEIAELDGARVHIAGFMIATTFADRRLEHFVLARFPPGCCFGAFPVYWEWASVTVPDDVEVDDEAPFQLITVTGRLTIGEVLDEEGFVKSIYRLSCEAIDADEF